MKTLAQNTAYVMVSNPPSFESKDLDVLFEATPFDAVQTQHPAKTSDQGVTIPRSPKPQGISIAQGVLTLEASLTPAQRHPVQFLVKRVADILVSSAVLLLGLPALLLTSLLLKLEAPSLPVFDRQCSQGQGDLTFQRLRFRSLESTPNPWEALPLLHGGIRMLRLNTLVSFLHVFVGDFSLVGPRVLSFQQSEALSPAQRNRFQLPAGVFAVAEADISHYVNTWSLKQDVGVLLLR
jgi:lipopolysaccharide/colanic/teichoic acid biosynthesis glycosyltransferase